jgi:CheY-like chemotaxis protein
VRTPKGRRSSVPSSVVGDDKLDAQVAARLIKRALGTKGSRERLAEALGVHPSDLARWAAGHAFPPQEVFEKILEVVLDPEGKARSAEAPARSPARPRALIADDPEGRAILARILGPDFDLVQAHTLTDALDMLQSGAVVKSRSIDVIVCGHQFEGSQMLRFLECVKGYRGTSTVPFIACRTTSSGLSSTSLAALREACEALGAIAYIDLPERARHHGEERAAVQFRDAVRGAVALRELRTDTLRVLVVDDNPDAAHMLSVLLRMAGHEVQKAANAADAMHQARNYRPDVAVIDIGMPGVSGYALAEQIRGEPWGPGLMLIAVTGWGREQDVARARAAGFDHHFLKPVNLETLLAVFPKK